MGELFTTSGEKEGNVVTPTPQLQGLFLPGIDNPQTIDGFGIVTPWGGGSGTRRYNDYGISPSVSNQSTQLYDLANSLVPAEGGGVSYNFEGLIGPRGLPGKDGTTTILHEYTGLNSNYLTALPHNIDQMNQLGTAADKIIYTDTYTTSFPDSDATWTERDPTGTTQTWNAMASDSDGSNLIAGAYNDRLYTSVDSGVNWTERQPAGDVGQPWRSVASDDDGSHLIAGVYGGRLWTSADSGANWTERTPAGANNKNWSRVASDSDGTHLIAAIYDGRLYTSADSGANWTERTPAGNNDKLWYSVASDSDGTNLIVGARTGRLYTSANYGVNWTERTPAGVADKYWRSVASDDDGSHLIAGVYGGRLWTSADSGANWTERTPAGVADKDWAAVASDSDGSTLIVGVFTGRLYVSDDSGANWTERNPAGYADRFWYSVASDSDGTHLIAGETRLYTGVRATYSEATYAETTLTSAGRALLDDTTAAAMATTLGLGTGDSPTLTGLTLSGLTQGSVVFAGASGVISQDNSNLFWDDTINRLGVGINSGFFPAVGITVSGEMDLIHTSSEPDDHAFEIDVDAAGYGDVKAIDIDYITGDITVGEDEAIILINIDEIGATGAADVFGLEVLATEGDAGIYGMKVGVVVGPIHQDSGTFENPTIATNDTPSTNVPYMIDGLIANVTPIFSSVPNDDDYILIGDIATFEEIEFIITTGSSGAGIKPKFEYSRAGSNLFTEFFPVDGTNGFRNTGVVAWDTSDLTNHGLNTDTAPDTYCIKITRQRTNLTTTPILGFAKVAATTEYIWDENGDVNLRHITSAGVVEAATKFQVTASGSAAVPMYTKSTDDDTGMYFPAANTVAFTTDSTLRLSISDSVITGTLPIDIGTTNALSCGSIELGHASDTTITRVSAGVIAVEGVTVMMVGGAPTAHTIVSHSDTTGTGAELNTLTGGGDVGALHSHAAAYQPLDAVLTDLAALAAVANNEFIVGTGAGTYAHENAATAATSMGLGTGDSPTFAELTLLSTDIPQLRLKYNEVNNSNKGTSISAEQYASDSEPLGFSLLGGYADSDENRVYIGGGWNNLNAATKIYFYIAADETTTIGTSVATISMSGLSLGSTRELTCGSINKSSGTLTLEIGGTAEISISSTTSTFGGNLVIPDAGYIGSVSDTNAFQIEADGDIVMSQDLAVTGTLASGAITQSGTTLANTYQPVHANLTSLATLTYAAASFVKMTGADTFALRTIGETADDLEGTIDHNSLANYAANQHYLQSAITAVGTIGTGIWQATDVGISYGGTGQSTAQAAINALSAVSGATNEHVLTKDTATGNAIFKVAAGGGGGSGGGTTVIFPQFWDSKPQGTWNFAVDANYLFNGYTVATADGDEIHYKTYLGAGTYTLKILFTKWTANGIADFYIDAVEVASVDGYGALAYNQIDTTASIVVAASGVKTIKVIIDGKHASSSAHGFNLQAMIFYRTA